MFRFALAAAAVCAFVAPTHAEALKIGSAAPKFANLESATTGKMVSLDDFKGKDVLVVTFTCNHCPVAQAYEGRFVQFANEFAGKDTKVAFLAVNVNNLPADKLDKMKDRAKDKGFTFDYVYDPSQKIAHDLGATRTPEVFVFDKSRNLVYHGAFDDSMKSDKVSKHYVADAVTAVLKGEKPTTPTTKPEGCMIKFDKK